MPHRTFNVDELAAYLHLPRADIERLVKNAEIPFDRRGGRVVFFRGEIDAWASQRILGLPENRLADYHRQSTRGTREVFAEDAMVPELLRPDYIAPAMTAKTRASIVRDMVALADKTGRVLDPREFLSSVEAREKLCSTALPGGLALLHSRNHDPYRFEGSFMVLGRTVQAIPCGAPDGRPTRLFFLICCQDDRIHLHVLARLCLVAHETDVVATLLAAPDRQAMYDALVLAEQTALFGKNPPPVVAGR